MKRNGLICWLAGWSWIRAAVWHASLSSQFVTPLFENRRGSVFPLLDILEKQRKKEKKKARDDPRINATSAGQEAVLKCTSCCHSTRQTEHFFSPGQSHRWCLEPLALCSHRGSKSSLQSSWRLREEADSSILQRWFDTSKLLLMLSRFCCNCYAPLVQISQAGQLYDLLNGTNVIIGQHNIIIHSGQRRDFVLPFHHLIPSSLEQRLDRAHRLKKTQTEPRSNVSLPLLWSKAEEQRAENER